MQAPLTVVVCPECGHTAEHYETYRDVDDECPVCGMRVDLYAKVNWWPEPEAANHDLIDITDHPEPDPYNPVFRWGSWPPAPMVQVPTISTPLFKSDAVEADPPMGVGDLFAGLDDIMDRFKTMIRQAAADIPITRWIGKTDDG